MPHEISCGNCGYTIFRDFSLKHPNDALKAISYLKRSFADECPKCHVRLDPREFDLEVTPFNPSGGR